MFKLSEDSVKKICIGIIAVFILMWVITSADKENKAMGDKYQEGYHDGYEEGYAAALSDYGIEQ